LKKQENLAKKPKKISSILFRNLQGKPLFINGEEIADRIYEEFEIPAIIYQKEEGALGFLTKHSWRRSRKCHCLRSRWGS